MKVDYLITGLEWTPISTSGQSGSCWLDEDDVGASNRTDVRIVHKAGDAPSEVGIVTGKRVYKPNSNEVLVISADSVDDIYYAKCRNLADTATICVDVV